MDALLGSKSVPPGFRFHPTDEELFMFYLKRKVMGKSLGSQVMSEVDVFQYAPWELPAKACLKTRDLNWYFLCPRSKKCIGGRANRGTIHGYWKSTGNDRTFNFKNRPVGKIKTLIFYRGKPPKGDRTDWVLHEYRLEDRVLLEQGVPQNSYVICKIFEKRGLGPRMGEDYGAPFIEEEWDSDNDDHLGFDRGLVVHPTECDTAHDNIALMAASAHNTTHTQQPAYVDFARGTMVGHDTPCLLTPLTPASIMNQPSFAPVEIPPPIETEEDELDRLLAMFGECDSTQAPPENDFLYGLKDVPGGSSTCNADSDWSQYLAEDWYLELKDLQD